MRMKSKIVALSAISAVLVILLAVILVFSGSFFPNCDSLENQVKDLLEEANYCSADSGCIANGLGCPFGCYNLVNKNADFEKIRWVAENYFNCLKGKICEYICISPPKQEQIKCINNKCVDIRLENK